LLDEGHSAAGWGLGGSVDCRAATAGPFVRAINGLPLTAPRRLLLVLVSAPL